MSVKLLDLDRIEAIKVVFKQPIFPGDFTDRGMKAWLTKIEVDDHCYKLFLNFKDFEAENEKYFTAVYFPNIHTKDIQAKTGRNLFTAIEAGCYNPVYSVYFGDASKSLEENEEDLNKYLKVIQ